MNAQNSLLPLPSRLMPSILGSFRLGVPAPSTAVPGPWEGINSPQRTITWPGHTPYTRGQRVHPEDVKTTITSGCDVLNR